MKFVLKSDFLDCYDHWFGRDGDIVFRRFAEESWLTSRSDMFKVFNQLGLPTPYYENVNNHKQTSLIVVYVDQYAHRGDGKILIKPTDALNCPVSVAILGLKRGVSQLSSHAIKRLKTELPTDTNATTIQTLGSYPASVYIADFPRVTYRLLACGDRTCWFRHESFEDWRSNAGDGKLYELTDFDNGLIFPSGFERAIKNPVWDIDFVRENTTDGGSSY